MKKKIYLTAVVGISVITLLWFINHYLSKPVELKIESSGYLLVSEVQSKLIRVATIIDPDTESFRTYDLKSLNIDFQKNYLIISSGREIIEVNYKRISKFTSPFNGPYEAIINLRDEFHPGKLYYYITEHIPCLIDVSSPKIYIEGRKVSVRDLILRKK